LGDWFTRGGRDLDSFQKGIDGIIMFCFGIVYEFFSQRTEGGEDIVSLSSEEDTVRFEEVPESQETEGLLLLGGKGSYWKVSVSGQLNKIVLSCIGLDADGLGLVSLGERGQEFELTF